jgi:hypothetical protein
MKEISGHCLCGAVRFEADGPPLFSAHCHCEWCRRAHGAAFVTWLGLREASFTIIAGESSLRWYASSEQSRRAFCTTCGTTLLFASSLAPGEMHVALACVDQPEKHPPTVHVFWDAHVSWSGVADELPKIGRDHAGLQKYGVISPRPASR